MNLIGFYLWSVNWGSLQFYKIEFDCPLGNGRTVGFVKWEQDKNNRKKVIVCNIRLNRGDFPHCWLR
jgi:hypothetical protein